MSDNKFKSLIVLVFLGFFFPSFPLKALNPDSLLQGQSKMDDSTLFARYKEIHQHYSSFAIDSAIYFGNQAINEATKRKAFRFLADFKMRVAVNYVYISDYPNAQRLLIEGLDLVEEHGFDSLITGFYNNLGIVSGATRNYEKAVEYYNKAIEINRKKENWIEVAINLGNLCGVLLEINKPEEAKKSIQQALAIYREKNDSILQSTALNNLGEVYLRVSQYDSAQFYLEKSLALKEFLNIQTRQPATLNLLGDLYMQTKDYNKVFQYYYRSFEISREFDLTFDEKMATIGLYKYFKAIGDPLNSLKYHEIYRNLQDSIFTIEKDRLIKELEIRYEVNKKNSEIEDLNAKVLTQRRLRNLGILILVLSVALFVLTYMRIRLRSLLLEKENELEKEKSKQLKFEVAEKNRELMSHSMLSIQKNQILNDLKDKLLAIDNRDQCINQAIRLVEENHSADSEWENLKIHFEGVHPGFFTKLQEACPDLTSTDLRHCAYIRIQMSSKDVARIMNVDPKSVKMTRYRLKKKLSLSEEDSLENYLINL